MAGIQDGENSIVARFAVLNVIIMLADIPALAVGMLGVLDMVLDIPDIVDIPVGLEGIDIDMDIVVNVDIAVRDDCFGNDPIFLR